MSYYNGIAGDGDHPELVYRSDFLTTPFAKPVGRFAHLPVKSVHGVFGTTLNKVWNEVDFQVRDLFMAREIDWSSIGPARFFTHGPPGEEEKGSLGPVVLWIAVKPGSTSPDTAHDVSQQILDLLRKYEVEGVVIEWREAVGHRLAGSPLMRHVGSTNATHYVRRGLTALLGVPLATEERESEDAQGTLTLWFCEIKDKNGRPSKKVYGVSNRHVLRDKYDTPYEPTGGAAKSFVRVCGMRRFQRILDDTKQAIADNGLLADLYVREIARLEAKEEQDRETRREIQRAQNDLSNKKEDIEDLEQLHADALKNWSDIKLHRNIGNVTFAPPITVDNGEGGTQYTSDWAVFEAAEAKVKDSFEGNIVDLGSKFTPQELMAMFYPVPGGQTTFKYPEERKLRIEGCLTEQELANPVEVDSEGERCLIVGKDGNTTDLTIGRYAGLTTFVRHDGVVSRELAIYNTGLKPTDVFSAKGDSGALVWHVYKGKARIVGQLHSGENKGGSTSNHVTYCTPGWYLVNQIKNKYKHADLYPIAWPA
ncbi:hypothetical protein SCHPADRAFT_916623 [Schizopora paradoxa]|uniref:Uncharacterized protein n=1 Tax=Schizopora paradoxa TaxID=27342 RepID=A0A0H2RY46_9AGAM|nr:hypothetical protein SCHPADRAFT_916623 [Schizopora paradoxa]